MAHYQQQTEDISGAALKLLNYNYKKKLLYG